MFNADCRFIHGIKGELQMLMKYAQWVFIIVVVLQFELINFQ